MVQFAILTGKQAGTVFKARRFPVEVGRDSDCDLRAEEDGVWGRHSAIEFEPARGFIFKSKPPALARVNAEIVTEALLRNGDVIEMGSLKLQFWFGETRQRGLGLREAVTWTAIAAITFGQVALVYWLSR